MHHAEISPSGRSFHAANRAGIAAHVSALHEYSGLVLFLYRAFFPPAATGNRRVSNIRITTRAMFHFCSFGGKTPAQPFNADSASTKAGE
jgi:hypothetical protein